MPQMFNESAEIIQLLKDKSSTFTLHKYILFNNWSAKVRVRTGSQTQIAPRGKWGLTK